MVEPSPRLDDFDVLIRQLIKRTHATTALILTATLEEHLSKIIEGNMPNLSENKKKELFEGYGPLSSLSAKIEIAYALAFILADERRNLQAIKSIRNAFAHSPNVETGFDHPQFSELLAKLPNATSPEKGNLVHFVEVCVLTAKALKRHRESIDLAKALKEGGGDHTPSVTH